MEIVEYADASDLTRIGDAWDRLSELQPRFVISFSELRHGLESSGGKFRMLVATEGEQVRGLACFVYGDIQKRFGVAEKKLFSLPVRVVTLFGASVLGDVDEAIVEQFLKRVIAASDFDLMNLGEVIIDSPLYRVVGRLRSGTIVNRVLRDESIRWVIRLPGSFEEYCKSLGAQTRKKDVGKFRKAEQQAPLDIRVVHRPEQVPQFLEDGEKVSRLTYQWNLGQRLYNDEATRRRLTRLAEKNLLRCYLLYSDGEPRAFGYGEISHGVYLYQASGYDPRHIKESPGTLLMLWMIRDVIEHTDCKVFDFGMGGNYEYKPRYGNTSVACAWIQIGRLYQPYSLLIVGLDQALNFSKNLATSVIGQGKLMQRLKKATRRYGDS